jgi:hypothetical protein
VQEINEEVIRKNMRSLWFLWGELVLVLFIYVVIFPSVLGDHTFVTFRFALPIAYMKYICYFAATAALVLAYYLRFSLLRGTSDKSKQRIEKRAARLNKPPIVVKYNTSVIVSVTMAQYAPILCLILFFLGGGTETLYIFATACFLMMLILRPNQKELDRLSEQWL